jgi:hypothetical protein
MILLNSDSGLPSARSGVADRPMNCASGYFANKAFQVFAPALWTSSAITRSAAGATPRARSVGTEATWTGRWGLMALVLLAATTPTLRPRASSVPAAWSTSSTRSVSQRTRRLRATFSLASSAPTVVFPAPGGATRITLRLSGVSSEKAERTASMADCWYPRMSTRYHGHIDTCPATLDTEGSGLFFEGDHILMK